VFKSYSFPEKYQEKIDRALKDLGYSLTKPKAIADSVIELSNFYQQKHKVTPWKDPATQAAYLAYYFPLNYIRNLKVFSEIERVGFLKNTSRLLDFGFGLGSGYLAAQDTGLIAPSATVEAVDSSAVPLELFKKYFMEPGSSISFSKEVGKASDFDTAFFSYALNEFSTGPSWLTQIPNLLIIEPSTQALGRQLMERRSTLIDTGYQMWAPCTHQEACPLLVHSKTDWCHDRVHWTPPVWWKDLEKFLPMKNQTMTFSYLAASRTPAPVATAGRVVGDELKEKGKSRWLYCRGEEREFLSWLNRSGEPPEIHRGELLKVNIEEKKGNELRFKL
jgi:ribosomal protein RSM22 (predicted rRNA methylase)